MTFFRSGGDLGEQGPWGSPWHPHVHQTLFCQSEAALCNLSLHFVSFVSLLFLTFVYHFSALVGILELKVPIVIACSKITDADSNEISKRYGCQIVYI